MDNPTQEIPIVDMKMAAATVAAEHEAFELFTLRFSQLNPAPVDPKQSMKDLLGWEFYGSIVVALATLLLAGFATAGEFFHIASATSTNEIFTWGRTISAILGVEGLIVVMSVLSVLTAEKNKISRNQYENAKKLALFVSVAAGVNGVLRGVLPMDNTWVQVVSFTVSAALAVGASFLALTGGEIIGYQTRSSRELLKSGQKEYLDATKVWKDELIDRFANSYERKIARGELRIPTSEKRSFGGNQRTNERTGPSEVETRILAYLRANASPENIPGKGLLGPSAVAVALGVSKGYASQIIGEYIEKEYRFKTEENVQTD